MMHTSAGAEITKLSSGDLRGTKIRSRLNITWQAEGGNPPPSHRVKPVVINCVNRPLTRQVERERVSGGEGFRSDAWSGFDPEPG
jgi:hypothetical protein